MRRLALAIAAAAVLAAPPVVADRAGSSRLEWLLGTRLTGTHVRLRAGARLRWRSDGSKPIAKVAADADDSFARLRAGDKGARIVIEGSAVRLAAFVGPADISPVIGRAVLLHPSRPRANRQAGDRTPGVHLAAGARIEPKRRGRRLTTAAVKVGAIEAKGLVETSALATEFVLGPVANRAEAGQWGQLKPPLVLRDRPGGPAVARLVGTDLVSVRILETRGKHALIAADEDRTTAIGWVSRRLLLPGEGTAWGSISGGGFGAHRIRLVEGSILADKLGGEPIGLMTAAASLRSYRRSGEWVEVDVRTDIGTLRVWASGNRMQSGTKDP